VATTSVTGWPRGDRERFVPQLVEVDRNKGSAIIPVRARQAVALDDGANRIGDVRCDAGARVCPCSRRRKAHSRRIAHLEKRHDV
jgi:hypothetical protein